jgi:hypothetical protein
LDGADPPAPTDLPFWNLSEEESPALAHTDSVKSGTQMPDIISKSHEESCCTKKALLNASRTTEHGKGRKTYKTATKSKVVD